MFPANPNSVKLKKSSFLSRGFNVKEKISVWIYPRRGKKAAGGGKCVRLNSS
jgi:hypothetical protein